MYRVFLKMSDRTNEIEQKIMEMYAKGMSQRDIEDSLREIYGSQVPQTLISKITDKSLPEVMKWQKRPLASFTQLFISAESCSKAARTVQSSTSVIFAVNRMIGEITLQRSGKPVNSVLKTDAAVAMSGTGERSIDPIEERALELKKLGYTRGETLDILVDEYMPENYDPSVSVLGYPQHEKLKGSFPSFWENIERVLSEGESYKSIENKLFTTYNMRKGISNGNSSFKERVNNLIIYKGAMWHVREKFKEKLRRTGINPDGAEGQSILQGSVTRLLGGSDGWRREQRRQGKSANGLNHSEKGGFFNGENEPKYSLDNSAHILISSIDDIDSIIILPIRQHIDNPTTENSNRLWELKFKPKRVKMNAKEKRLNKREKENYRDLQQQQPPILCLC